MMMFIISLLVVSLMALPGGETEKKAETTWSTFEEGVEQAKKSNKKIMLDIYTDWCGWCKKLDREVYANKDVAKYLNESYVSIKINAESGKKFKFKGKEYTEQQLAAGFGATGYPTIVFLKSDSDMITKLGGYVEAERFLKILKFLGEDHYEKMKWEEFLDKEEKGSKKK